MKFFKTESLYIIISNRIILCYYFPIWISKTTVVLDKDSVENIQTTIYSQTVSYNLKILQGYEYTKN